MGKVRIKQIGAGFEEIKKAKRKKKKKRATAPAVSRGGSPGIKEKRAELKEASKVRDAALASEEEKRKTKTPSVSRPPRSNALAARHSGKRRGHSARYEKLAKTVGAGRGPRAAPTIREAVRLAQQTATANFPESIEAHINTIKTGFRTTVSLPYPTGKKPSILILTSEPEAYSFNKAKGATLKIAGPEKVAAIKKSGSPPDVNEIWATPDIMAEIAAIARILGPAGLMPNPKRGTVIGKKASGAPRSGPPGAGEYAGEITAKLKELTSGRAILETERKAPIIHTVLGKADMDGKKLAANMEAILSAIGTNNIKKVVLSSTMGPPIRLAA